MKSQIGAKVSAPKSANNKNENAPKSSATDLIELGIHTKPKQLAASTYIKVDHATLFDNIAIISGWMSIGAQLQFSSTLKLHAVKRPDADAVMQHATTGFIVIVAMPVPRHDVTGTIQVAERQFKLNIQLSSKAEEVVRSMEYFAAFSKGMVEHYVKSRLLSQFLATKCNDLPADQRTQKNAHLDVVRTISGFGYVASGWAISRTKADFWLLTSDGHWFPLSQSVRYNRPDVTDAFVDSFGAHTAESGFFSVVQHPQVGSETKVRLVVATNGGLLVVHQAEASTAPQTPLSYARWAFSLPTPASKFFNRLAFGEGALIEHLINEHRTGYPIDVEVWNAGAMLPDPEVSIIVPLFGRLDFVEYQLAHFANDPDFSDGTTELIYVIDDPVLVEPLRQSCHQLFELYKIPFRLVWGKINRGYSGANNLGLGIARGTTVILLNSDVFPIDSGWVNRMNDELKSDEKIGAVGARLEYADGSIQHQGMAFSYSNELNVWLNQHPKRGLDLPPPSNSFDVEAATGACLAVRRQDLVELGGMDEGFLIGDFEDSDLCLKLRALRGRIVIAAGTRLVHLERQSFSNLGNSDFRTSIVKFNAWRHHRRWATTIAALKESVNT